MRTRLVAGFTLIEVAITMVILAAGTISLLFLQLANLKAARETAARSAAMQYSVELADWIRVAAAPMAKAGTTVESVLMARNTASEATLVAHPTSCFDTICDPDQQATFALRDWDKRLRLAVPGAEAPHRLNWRRGRASRGGAAARGGDWELEVRAGDVTAALVVDVALAASYGAVLSLGGTVVTFGTSANFISRGNNFSSSGNVIYRVSGSSSYQLKVDGAITGAYADPSHGNVYVGSLSLTKPRSTSASSTEISSRSARCD